MELKIQKLPEDDVYRDIVRIPEDHRFDSGGRKIPEGVVCSVRINGKSRLVVLRGVAGIRNHLCQEPCAHLDDVTRNHLGIVGIEAGDFHLKPGGWWAELCWAWRTSEIGYRISSRIAAVSLFLGLLGVVLGILSIWQSRRSAPVEVTGSPSPSVEADPTETAQYILKALSYPAVELPSNLYPFTDGQMDRKVTTSMEGNCLVEARYYSTVPRYPSRFESNEATIRINLHDAELGGVQAEGAKVTLRSASGFDAVVTVDDKVGAPQKTTGRFPKVDIPTVDEPTALRLSRALEAQIANCGGKPDRFAK